MTRVLIAVGHGRRPDGRMDNGASRGARTEQSEGSLIAQPMAERLRQFKGVEVRLIDRGGPNWQGAANAANNWPADYAIEIHHDWTGAPRGAFGHWHSSSPRAKQLADMMLAAVVGELDYPTRPTWHRARDELGWVRTCRMPAVLWECDRIAEVVDHEAYGRALAHGVAEFLDLYEEEPELSPEERKLLMDTAAAVQRIEQSLDGRRVGDDLRRIRLTDRAVADKLGLETEHPVEAGPVPA